MEADAEAIRAAVLLDEIMQAAPEHSTARIVVVRLRRKQAHTGPACFIAPAQTETAKLTPAFVLFKGNIANYACMCLGMCASAVAPAPSLQGMSWLPDQCDSLAC